jgi:hypothetical protein
MIGKNKINFATTNWRFNTVNIKVKHWVWSWDVPYTYFSHNIFSMLSSYLILCLLIGC